jgi:hypothetical protein
MPNPALEWPPAQIEALRTMAEQGQPASMIARALTAEFGIARSRSAVIGKLFRLREAAALSRCFRRRCNPNFRMS